MRRHFSYQVPRDRAGISLLHFLAGRFPYRSRDGWAERIAAGRVTVNGRPAQPECVLAFRDGIEYLAEDLSEPPVAAHVEIVFDDADLLVVNKPPNLPCHPGGRYFEHTLWGWARRHAGLEQPEFVNRIDRETSGLVVLARTAAAARRCRAQFASRRVAKRYVALVEGAFPETCLAEGWLAPDESGPVRKRRRFVPGRPGETGPPKGQWAVTRFRLAVVHGPISEVTVTPETGRLHQIRATLFGLGYPLVGDKLYGFDPEIFLRFCTDDMSEEDRRCLRLPRQALHAEGLSFRHPRTGALLDLHVPVPDDMRSLAARCERAASRHDSWAEARPE